MPPLILFVLHLWKAYSRSAAILWWTQHPVNRNHCADS